MIYRYGLINTKDEYINCEYKTLKGAKIGASKRGYTKIGLRRGYSIIKVWTKKGTVWMEGY